MSGLGAAPALVVVGVGAATGAATLAGGLLALRLRAALPLLLGFSAGAVVGVALFDLLPEAVRLGAPRPDALALATAMGAGFGGYLLADRLATRLQGLSGALRANFGPASLTAHSLLDGLGVGLAFHVSSAAGLVVALAVLAHDLFDGANTITLSLDGGAGRRGARAWLVADACAPLAGIFLARTLAVPAADLAVLLAVFAGFFLYIGASELAPRASLGPRPLASGAASAAGLALIWLVVRLAGG
ncbi:MAG TPA: hypothetical protein VG248_05315 [Caulobacteraceae bacterium]|nr:hypothetical protein [Caulobacteraceae bacterium]